MMGRLVDEMMFSAIAVRFVVLSASVLLLVGCGGGEPEQTDTMQVSKKEPAPAPAPVVREEKPTPLPTFDEVKVEGEVNFGSLIEFPDLKISTSESDSDLGDPKYPVLEGGKVEKPEGQPNPAIWLGVAPATYEIEIPQVDGTAMVKRVEVQDVGGDHAFPECVVFIKTADSPEWQRPEGIEHELLTVGDSTGRTATRHVFKFPEVAATTVQIAFSTGSKAQPNRVSVRDIDVYGSVQK